MLNAFAWNARILSISCRNVRPKDWISMPSIYMRRIPLKTGWLHAAGWRFLLLLSFQHFHLERMCGRDGPPLPPSPQPRRWHQAYGKCFFLIDIVGVTTFLFLLLLFLLNSNNRKKTGGKKQWLWLYFYVVYLFIQLWIDFSQWFIAKIDGSFESHVIDKFPLQTITYPIWFQYFF